MKNKITTLFYILIGVVTLSPFLVNAESPGTGFQSPIGFSSFGEVVAAIVGVVVQVGVVLVILAIIYSGFLFVTAQGNEEKISKAKRTFLWVIVGAIILLGANELADVVRNTANALK